MNQFSSDDREVHKRHQTTAGGNVSKLGEENFRCPTPGCGRKTKFIREAVEAPINTADGLRPRFYIVECPEHGHKLLKMTGERITRLNKGPRKVS
jgi:hypothetical protein